MSPSQARSRHASRIHRNPQPDPGATASDAPVWLGLDRPPAQPPQSCPRFWHPATSFSTSPAPGADLERNRNIEVPVPVHLLAISFRDVFHRVASFRLPRAPIFHNRRGTTARRRSIRSPEWCGTGFRIPVAGGGRVPPCRDDPRRRPHRRGPLGQAAHRPCGAGGGRGGRDREDPAQAGGAVRPGRQRTATGRIRRSSRPRIARYGASSRAWSGAARWNEPAAMMRFR